MSVSVAPFQEALGASKVAATSQRRYYQSSNSSLIPAVVVTPETTEDVAATVKLIRQHGCPFAICSGGVNVNQGFAAVADGVLIDLCRLKAVEVSPDHKTVTIQPGAIWGDVYELLTSLNKSVAGARFPGVGCGGFLMGGGLSYHSSLFGLACDNIVSHRIVLADGSVVDTSRDGPHADLFQALKGGTSRFGIVTHFTVLLHDVTSVLSSVVRWPRESQMDVVRIFADHYKNYGGIEQDKYFNYLPIWLSYGGHRADYAAVVYLGPSTEERPGCLSELAAVPKVSIDSHRININDAPKHNAYDIYGTWPFWECPSMGISEELMRYAVVQWESFVEKVEGKYLVNSMTFEPISSYMAEVALQKGGNALGVQAAPYMLVHLNVHCPTKETHDIVAPLATAMIDDVMQEAERLGLGPKRDYGTALYPAAFPGQPAQELPRRLPFSPNHSRSGYNVYASTSALPILRQVQAKYDPERFFDSGPGFSLHAENK